MAYLGKRPTQSTRPVNNSVTTDTIVNGAVSTPKLADGAVANTKLAANAVTEVKIADGAVTGQKMATGATAANLGYTPANKAGDTLGPIALSPTNGEINGNNRTYVNLNAKYLDLQNVSGTINIDVSQAEVFRIKPTGSVTINFTSLPPAGVGAYWEIEVDGPGTNTVTFNGVTWDGNRFPGIAGGTRTTVYSFRTTNGSKVMGTVSFLDII